MLSLLSEVTRILSAIEQGDLQAAEQLLPLVYEELRQIAAQKLAPASPGQTLQATALVHEAYLRLVDTEKAQHWNSRGPFFAAAALRSLLGNLHFDKAGLIRGIVGADPQNASILQPDDDRILAAQIPDPTTPDAGVDRLLPLRFGLSPRPGKMKNSWKKNRRRAIRKPELETIIAHRRKWRSRIETAPMPGLSIAATWECPEWVINCKGPGGEAVTDASPRSCWRRSVCTS